jgi:Fe-S cluster biogenesis protein NfuA
MQKGLRLLNRINKPSYKVNQKVKEMYINTKEGKYINLKLEIKNSGKLNIFGLIDSEQVPPKVLKLKYTTNITNEALAIIDVFIEFCINKNLKHINNITLREIENYLRDENSLPCIKDEAIDFHQLFNEIKKTFNSLDDNHNTTFNTSKNSPTIKNDYKEKGSYFPFNKINKYTSLNSSEKIQLIQLIINDHIANPLAKDSGSVYCTWADESIVVIQYEGQCLTCNKSLTSTMDYIQTVIQLSTQTPSILVITDS